MTSDTTSTKRERARALLMSLLQHRDRVPISEAVAAGAEIGVSRRTLTRACGDLGIREIHNGPFSGFWERPAASDRPEGTS